MKIEGVYRGLREGPETIYNLITDPGILKQCIPGCKELKPVADDKYWLDLSWGYSGFVVVERTSPPERLRLTVDGKGVVGNVKAKGNLELQSEGSGCIIKYTGEFYIGGPAALLQRGLSVVGGIPYNKMLRSFFDTFVRVTATG